MKQNEKRMKQNEKRMKPNKKKLKQNEKICYKFMFCPKKNVLFDTSCKFKLYDTTHTYFSTHIQKKM